MPLTPVAKVRLLKRVSARSWRTQLGALTVEDVQETPEGNLWVSISSPDFECDPDGYYFVNPPLRRRDGVEDHNGAFREMVTDAATYYATHPEVWGRTTTTVFGDASDGRVESANVDYATFRAGSTLNVNTTGPDSVFGQRFTTTYNGRQLFLAWDTSSIPDSDTIESVVLALFGESSAGSAARARAWSYDWGATLETADWRDATAIAALTEVANFPGVWSTIGYNEFTSTPDFAGAVSKTGFTRLVVTTDRYEAGTVPTGDERLGSFLAEETGTTKDPKLVINHSAGGTPVGISRSLVWNQRAAVGVSRTLLHNVLAKAGASRTLLWDSRSAVGAARTLLWDIVAAPPPAAPTVPRRRHEPKIPKVYCRLDNRSIGLDDWLATTIANGGCDTLRGIASEKDMRKYPSSFEQGAPIRLVLANGRIIWEGELDANPLPYNGRVSLFGRGPMVWAEEMQDSYEATGANTTISRIFVDAAGQLGYDVRAIPLGPPGPRSSSPAVDNFVYLVSKGLTFDEKWKPPPLGGPGGLRPPIKTTPTRTLIGGWTTPAILTHPMNILPFTWGEGGGANWAGMFDHLVDMLGWRWRVGGDHYGNGPVMDMGPWGPAHDARLRSNAVPQLSLTTTYRRVEVLYETALGKAKIVREVDPETDPLAHRGRRARPRRVVLPNIQTDDTLASQIADNLMEQESSPRPVGSLDLVGLSGDADETVFDAQGGDVITIGDLAPGAMPLLIAQTEMSKDGVKAGIGRVATFEGLIALYEKSEANLPGPTIRRRMDVKSVAEAMLISEFKPR